MTDFEALVSEVQIRDRHRPSLAVLGSFDHFGASLLGKVAERYLAAFDGVEHPDRQADASILWFKDVAPVEHGGRGRLINARLRSVEKRTVVACFEETFGYSLSVDPLEFAGPCVAKSNLNAQHDGRLLEAPIAEADPSLVYQRLVDNVAGLFRGEAVICDFRLPVILGHVPFAYLKFRPQASRFSNTNLFVKLAAVTDVLTVREVDLCLEFCRRLGLDYGEIDVLRDRNDGRLYVVDANNRSFGPPKGLHPMESDIALRLIGEAVVRRFFNPAVPILSDRDPA